MHYYLESTLFFDTTYKRPAHDTNISSKYITVLYISPVFTELSDSAVSFAASVSTYDIAYVENLSVANVITPSSQLVMRACATPS